MKLAIFTAALASAASLFTGAVAAPQPADVSTPERAVSPQTNGPISVIDLAVSVKDELTNAHNKLQSTKRANQNGEVLTHLTNYFGDWNQHFKKDNSVSLNGTSSPNIITVILDIIETFVSIFVTLVKDAPGEVAALLKEIAALVFDIGNGLSKGFPEFSWFITPLAHLAGAVLIAIANALAPSSSNKAALTPHAMMNAISLN